VYCFQNGAVQFDDFGTGLNSPCWAGLIAIADQGRLAARGTTLNSAADPMQALQALYSLPASDFHQITTGYNGLSPTPGYNEVTGLGSPIHLHRERWRSSYLRQRRDPAVGPHPDHHGLRCV